jgi:predicted MFS family arabinose efflux permease
MIIGAFSGAAFFSSSYYSMANFALRRQRSSVNEFFVGFGSFVGPLAFGYLAERHGLSAPFVYMPVVIALGLMLQYYLIVRGRRQLIVDS